ncbi:MAG: hypothetical protein HY343_05135, partial [Lentisphaerae bacterium]|nr:hypothetical protein [Lentisphaerota bacterium]
WAWGQNSLGQLGVGSYLVKTTPVQVSNLTATTIAAGGYHSLARKSDGTVWTWGQNNYGQLGIGSLIRTNVPVQVSGLSGMTQVAAGLYHSLALKSDGSVYAWGYNLHAELGIGNKISTNRPVLVSGVDSVAQLAAGWYHSLAMKDTGAVWSWGNNVLGQLGDGTATLRTAPVHVNGDFAIPSSTNLTATDGTVTNRVNLTWAAVPGATSYEIWRNTLNNNATAGLLAEPAAPSYADTNAVPSNTYYYWVKSKYSDGISGFSAGDSGYAAFDIPTNLTASDGTSTNAILLAWTGLPYATGYEIWRNWVNDANSAERVTTIATTSYSDTAVLALQPTYYWIRAKNTSGAGPLSAPDSGYRELTGGTGSADLSLTNFSFLPRLLQPGSHPGVVSLKVSNSGPDPNAFPDTRLMVAFYLSRNTVFGDGDDEWIGDHLTDITVPSGRYALLLLSDAARANITIPGGASGNYYVFARVSHAAPSTLTDPVPANDRVMRAGLITVDTATAGGVFNDCNGDGVSDLILFNAAAGQWFAETVEGSIIAWAVNWGGAGMKPIPGDFNGDGTNDLAVYHESTGAWYIRTLDGAILAWNLGWGGANFKPVWGDYDSDGRSDLTVYHDASYWFAQSTDAELLVWGETWGAPGFLPVPGDYDGDGQADFAVWDTASGNWYIRTVAGATLAFAFNWGGPGMMPVSGDFDGDGISDLAVYTIATGAWYIKNLSGTVIAFGTVLGGAGMVPVSGDYDGDGNADLAVYNEATGKWFITTVGGSVIAWDLGWGGPGMAASGAAW